MSTVTSPAESVKRRTNEPVWSFLIKLVIGVVLLTLAYILMVAEEKTLCYVTIFALLYYAFFMVTSIKMAHWGTYELVGARLVSIPKEGLRFVLWPFITIREYSGEIDPITVKGQANMIDGSLQQFSGTIAIVRDHEVKDSRDRPRYPEAHRLIFKEDGLKDRFAKVIENLASYCTGDDLQKKDVAVQLCLSCMLRLQVPPHIDKPEWEKGRKRLEDINPGDRKSEGEKLDKLKEEFGRTVLPDKNKKVIQWYDTNKALVLRLLESKAMTLTRIPLEEQFGVKVIEAGVTFNASPEDVKAERLVRETMKFRDAQKILEQDEEGKDGSPGKARMDVSDSRKTVTLIAKLATGNIIESVGGSGDPLGLLAAKLAGKGE